MNEHHVKAIATQICRMEVSEVHELASLVYDKAVSEGNGKIVFPFQVLSALTKT
jgi:hypothetical protein